MPSDPQESLKISVIVPVYNGGDAFRVCLGAIVSARPAPFEIIVVADGDTDGSFEAAGSYGTRRIRLPVSKGAAAARNAGARIAEGDVLFFLDADVRVPPDIFTSIKSAFQAHPEAAALFGSYDDRPGDGGFFSQYKNLLHHFVHQNAAPEAFTFWTGCGGVRRNAFFAVGGFDEQYLSIEDIEFGGRLKSSGYAIRLCKEIQATHLKRWTFWSLIKCDIFKRAVPWARLLLRQKRIVNDLNTKLSHRGSFLLVLLFLCTFAAGCLHFEFFFLTGLAATALCILNRKLYLFFLQKRGWWFALRSIPMHWLYYFYSGMSFLAIALLHFFRKKNSARVGVSSKGNIKKSSG